MHIDALVGRLTKVYGEPIKLDGRTAVRWDIRRRTGVVVHLCISIEDASRHSSIWVFDPSNRENPATYLRVNAPSELDWVLAAIHAKVS